MSEIRVYEFGVSGLTPDSKVYTPRQQWWNMYDRWESILSRCYNKTCRSYPQYGAKGITVCDAWREDVEQFIQDMGYPPGKYMSIDRIDTSGPYSPENCRWATKFQQQQNMRNNINIEYKGKTQCLAVWARELGMGYQTLYLRLKNKWSVEKAFTTPVRKRTNKDGVIPQYYQASAGSPEVVEVSTVSGSPVYQEELSGDQ